MVHILHHGLRKWSTFRHSINATCQSFLALPALTNPSTSFITQSLFRLAKNPRYDFQSETLTYPVASRSNVQRGRIVPVCHIRPHRTLGQCNADKCVPWSRMEVATRKYRFRILNGSNARRFAQERCAFQTHWHRWRPTPRADLGQYSGACNGGASRRLGAVPIGF